MTDRLTKAAAPTARTTMAGAPVAAAPLLKGRVAVGAAPVPEGEPVPLG